MFGRGQGDHRADQIVSQQVASDRLANHLRRLVPVDIHLHQGVQFLSVIFASQRDS